MDVPAVPVPTVPTVPVATEPGPVCIPGVTPVVAGVPIVPVVPAVPVVVPDVCATASDEASARATVIKRFRIRISPIEQTDRRRGASGAFTLWASPCWY